MKIIFFGTANVALPVLEQLHSSHQVMAVVTSPDAKVGRQQEFAESPVSALARDLQIPTLKPETIKDNSDFFSQIQGLGAEIFVLVAYGKILPAEFLNLPQYGVVNVHFSLLPKYRGPSPIQFALLNGESQTGNSIFLLNDKIDDGPLLAQEPMAIEPYDNYFTLSDKLARLAAKMIHPVLSDYVSGKITPLPQDETLASQTKIIAKQDGKIDWQKSAREIYNQFRAFYPWPGIYTFWNGKILKITDCLPAEDNQAAGAAVGTVLDYGQVVCGRGTLLQIKELQLEGKKETPILDFLNGYQGLKGSRLDE